MKQDLFEGIVSRLFATLRIEVNEKRISLYSQFIKFCIVGVTNSIISYVINIAVISVLSPYQFAWDYLAGNVAQFVLSVLWSYYWNNRLVFVHKEQKKRRVLQTLLKTYAAYGFTGIILTNILSYLWINILGISKYVSPIINLILCTPINFIINKMWTFSDN